MKNKNSISSQAFHTATYILMLLFCFSLFIGCANNRATTQEETAEESRIRGIYHWKTTFRLTPQDSLFFREKEINRLYLHLFDVDYGDDFDGREKAVPIATTQFRSAIPENIEVVPVVYITPTAIQMSDDFGDLLYDRILAMAQRNHFGRIKEIQLDCDWTKTTQAHFFHLCEVVRRKAHADSLVVSATVRLHQLRQAAPPVDKGVLMIYNTGSIYNPEAQNSILDYNDIAPYFKSDIHFDLPLSLAFPTYRWGLLFRNGKFECILHSSDFNNPFWYRKKGNNKYEVVRSHYLENEELLPGDIIRLESPEFRDIERVKQLALSKIQSTIEGNLLYHLDATQLSKYSDSEIKSILQ